MLWKGYWVGGVFSLFTFLVGRSLQTCTINSSFSAVHFGLDMHFNGSQLTEKQSEHLKALIQQVVDLNYTYQNLNCKYFFSGSVLHKGHTVKHSLLQPKKENNVQWLCTQIIIVLLFEERKHMDRSYWSQYDTHTSPHCIYNYREITLFDKKNRYVFW